MDAVEAAQSGHPGHADGAGPCRLRALDPLPAAQSRRPRLARSRPLRALLRPRLDAAVLRCSTSRATTCRWTSCRRSGSGARARRAIRSGGTRRASRPRPVRWARASATRWAWRSPSASSPSTSTGRATAIVDHRTWAFASDGDLMEGVASEAASLAGHLRLGKLTRDLRRQPHHHRRRHRAHLLARTCSAGSRPTAGTSSGSATATTSSASRPRSRPRAPRPAADAGDPADRTSPIRRRPSATPPKAHGAPLGAEEVRRTKEIMGWPTEPAVLRARRRAGALARARWTAAPSSRRSGEERWQPTPPITPRLARGAPAAGCRARCPRAGIGACRASRPAGGALATRQASGLALQAIAAAVPNLVGGSADLGGSTGTTLKQGGTFGPDRHRPDQFHWGVREHGMASCLNGIAAHGGLRPFGSTFLVFSDYMKPAIRLAAIMRLPVIYIGTHDSIGLGEDGPTHQPVEHLAMLRAIPNLVVLRPARRHRDGRGVAGRRWQRRDGPTLLVLTRQKLPVLDRPPLGPAEGVAPRRVRAARPAGRRAAGHPHRHRLRGPRGARRGPAAPGRPGAGAGGLDAVLGAVRGPARGATGTRCCRRTSRVRLGIEAASPFGWLRWVSDEGAMLAMDGLRRVGAGRAAVRGVQVHPRARGGAGTPAAGPAQRAGEERGLMNPLVRLGELGQSPWYDYITRDLVASGELARLIADDGLRGMTSNPTIFEKAVAGSRLYDEDIRRLGRRRAGRRARSSRRSPWPTCAPPATRSPAAPAHRRARRAGVARGVARRWRTTPRPRSTRPTGCGRRWTGPTR